MKKLSVLTNREELRALIARLCALRCVELSEEALGSEADGTALESGGDPDIITNVPYRRRCRNYFLAICREKFMPRSAAFRGAPRRSGAQRR